MTLRADDDAAKAALDDVQSMNLPELLIVSQCLVGGDVPADAVTGTGTNFPGLHISVHNAPGTKCPRCWMHSETPDEHGLCPRCAAVVKSDRRFTAGRSARPRCGSRRRNRRPCRRRRA